MPPLGQTSDELRVLAWLKREGETVREGEPLLEIETDKATLEVEASTAGTLLRTLCGEGERVSAGTILGWLGFPGEALPEAEAASPSAAAPQDSAAAPAPSGGARVLATPAARTRARELGVEIASLSGSGPGGRIERRDVDEAAGSQRPSGSALAS